MMNMRKINVLFSAALPVLLIMGCSHVPITNRSQLNLIPTTVLNTMSFQSYGEFLSENKLSTDVEKTAMVQRAGVRIQQAVETYCREHSISMEGYAWEFHLVQGSEVNAWAMPGGKVVVYEGLLTVARNEAELAVVMGHEIAHAIAGHGNERMSHGLLVDVGEVALSQALKEKPAATQQLFNKSYGIGTQLGFVLPYSRLHESEADHLGLIFMAMAGYDPNVAVDFWQRMAASKTGSVPELLSTHPADATRIRNIQKQLPEAKTYYDAAKNSL